MLEVTELGRTDLAFAVRSAGEPHPRQYLSYSQLPAPSGASSLVGSQDRCVRQRGHTERPGICYVRAAYTHPDRAVGGQDGQVAVLEAGWSREDMQTLVSKSNYTRRNVINRTIGGWTWYNRSKQEAEMNLDLL